MHDPEAAKRPAQVTLSTTRRRNCMMAYWEMSALLQRATEVQGILRRRCPNLLFIDKCRRQAYDGTANTSGHLNANKYIAESSRGLIAGPVLPRK